MSGLSDQIPPAEPAWSRRCSKKARSGTGAIIRCEDVEGHLSAHYCGDEWWPNEDGLPEAHPRSHWWQWLVMILLGAVLGMATYWFLVR